MSTFQVGDMAPLTVQWQDIDGASAAVTGVQITISPTGGGAAIVGPTSTGVTNPVAGVNVYTWSIASVAGEYLASWTGIDPFGDDALATEVVTVTAAPTNLYTDLPTVKEALGKDSVDDRDDLIASANASASRLIDRRTGRRFYADTTATARLYSPTSATLTDLGDVAVLVDDIASTTDLAVAYGTTGTSWTDVDEYETGPDNALAYGRPITQIRAGYGWLPSLSRVQVTAQWGWPAVPDEIAQAATLLAARLYRRKDSPQGVMGSADWGFTRVSRTDPDVEALIAPFIRPIVF